MRRELRSPRGRSLSGRTSPLPCKDYTKGTCTTPFCEKWHPPECLCYKTKNGCRFWKRAHSHIVRLMNSLVKGPKRMMTKVLWPCWRSMSCMIERRAFSEIFHGAEWAKIIRNPQSKGKKSQWWSFDCLARNTSKELAPIHSVKSDILQNAFSTSPKIDAELGKGALMSIARLKNSQAKGLRRMLTQVQWLWSKIIRPLGCVFQGVDPPKSSSMLRRNSFLRKPIRYVRFTDAVGRHANIRDQNPSLGMICPADPHQRHPNAPTFDGRSQEETEWQERCAREAARKFAKHFWK